MPEMYEVVVKNENEYVAARIAAMANGMHIACISDAGLRDGSLRVTFVPDEAFYKSDDTGCDDDKLDGSADDWRKALEHF